VTLFTSDCFRLALNPPRVKAMCGDHFSQADFNQAAVRRTHSRVAERTVEMI